MSEKFPMIEKLGLEVACIATFSPSGNYYVSAADVEKLLDEGVEVQGWFPSTYLSGTWTSSETIHPLSSHTGLLIGIKPIEKPDTAESLLKELFETSNTAQGLEHHYSQMVKILARAKRLTGGGK